MTAPNSDSPAADERPQPAPGRRLKIAAAWLALAAIITFILCILENIKETIR